MMRVIVPGTRNIWWRWTVRPVALRNVYDVSIVMGINHEIHFSWQGQYLVTLDGEVCWSAQYHSVWRWTVRLVAPRNIIQCVCCCERRRACPESIDANDFVRWSYILPPASIARCAVTCRCKTGMLKGKYDRAACFEPCGTKWTVMRLASFWRMCDPCVMRRLNGFGPRGWKMMRTSRGRIRVAYPWQDMAQTQRMFWLKGYATRYMQKVACVIFLYWRHAMVLWWFDNSRLAYSFFPFETSTPRCQSVLVGLYNKRMGVNPRYVMLCSRKNASFAWPGNAVGHAGPEAKVPVIYIFQAGGGDLTWKMGPGCLRHMGDEALACFVGITFLNNDHFELKSRNLWDQWAPKISGTSNGGNLTYVSYIRIRLM